MNSEDILGLEEFLCGATKNTANSTSIKGGSPLATEISDSEAQTNLAFFISCTDIEGTHTSNSSRHSAQTLVRGALSMISNSSASLASKVKPVSSQTHKQITENIPFVAVQTHLGQEQCNASATYLIPNVSDLIPSNPDSTFTSTATFCTERQKSKCPSFQVGCCLSGRVSPAYDRQIMFQIVLPDENSNSYGYKTAPIYGTALTSFQKMLCIAQSGNFEHSMKLPVHSLRSSSSATCILHFIDISPQKPQLFRLYRPILKCFRFENPHTDQFVTEEAAQIDQTLQIPLEMLQISISELETARDHWLRLYHQIRLQKCYFESDAEALRFGHDVYRVQVIGGRDLRHCKTEEENGSKDSNFLAQSRNQLVNKWISPKKSSDASFFDGKQDVNGKGLNVFAVIRFLHGNVGNERVVGRTNTEYGTHDPIWGNLKTNKNARTLPKYFVPAEPFTDVQISCENELKEFVFYHNGMNVLSEEERMSGCFCVQIYDEQHTLMGGTESQLLGQVFLPIASVSELMQIDSVRMSESQLLTRYCFDQWLDIRPVQNESLSCGQIRLQFSILLCDTTSATPVAKAETIYPLSFLYAHVLQIQQTISEMKQRMETYHQKMKEQCFFKSSMEKKCPNVQELPTNLHVSYFAIYQRESATEPWRNRAEHVQVTCGAPAAHFMGLQGGLLELQAEIRRLLTNAKDSESSSKITRPTLIPEDTVKETHIYRRNFGMETANMLSSHAKYPNFESEDAFTDTNTAQICRVEMLSLQYQTRSNIAVTQAASALITCFLTCVDRWLSLNRYDIFEQLAHIGFLIGFESLISSQGKELSMISDAYAAMEALRSFVFQLRPLDEKSSFTRLEKCNNGSKVVVSVCIPQDHFDRLPSSLRSQEIPTTLVLFTQGINEMQSFANIVGHSGVSMQARINSTSLKSIREYYAKFSQIHRSPAIEQCLDRLQSAVEGENASYKNTFILLYAADAVRSLHGGRVTYCKSGKDRTAMSVTMEQARFFMETQNDSNFAPTTEKSRTIANILREFGVRIEIAKRNIGKAKYSFNSFQRKLLPEIFRPPMSTIQDMVTSVTARDS